MLAVVLWGVAVLLMHQGVYFQRWATKDDETAPDPSSGTNAAWIVSIAIMVIWLIRRLMIPDPQYSSNLLGQLIWAILIPSQDFVLATLISSVPLGVVALVKLSIASSISRRSLILLCQTESPAEL
jgi:hypothetical protein